MDLYKQASMSPDYEEHDCPVEGRAKMDPRSYEEASQSLKWRELMNMEIKAIERNKTWELSDAPNGVTPIGVKWIFKTKLNKRGNVEKHKARLVAKGYSQQYGMDYTKVFAPVARLNTVRILLALAAQHR
ncbi:uncharacterized protein LOC113862357 [Abrus precatorius]|uniref:Uncharacterized protein LOC113862357 n=1 Tax=Abrus precatorius TaxID=3816 RepID=A0A8B8L4X7_ABRPR|nr:uncharacterized protein LOC113862357 [Abrus precatorius]